MKTGKLIAKTLSFVLVVAAVCMILVPVSAMAEEPSETHYGVMSDAVLYSDVKTETINYSTKSTESYLINPTFPHYYNTNGALYNECVSVTGAMIVGFYDRYFDELIPDCSVGALRSGTYRYYPMSSQTAKKQAVIDELYTLMQTNVIGLGVKHENFQSGLDSYVAGKGRTLTFQSVRSGYALDMNKAKSALNSGKLVLLYLSNFYWADVQDSGSVVTISQEASNLNQIVIVYGYDIVSYFNASGSLIQKYTYLKVTTGLENRRSGATFILEGKYGLDAAESVVIS